MKRLPILLIMVLVLLGGCFANNNDKDYNKKVSKAEKIIENHIKSNYEDVEEVTFTEHEKSPMGGEVFRGKVNGGAEFSATFNMSDLTIGTIGQKKGFPPIKEECCDKICE